MSPFRFDSNPKDDIQMMKCAFTTFETFVFMCSYCFLKINRNYISLFKDTLLLAAVSKNFNRNVSL